MDIQNCFSSDGVSFVTTVLERHCQGTTCVTRTHLAQELGWAQPLDPNASEEEKKVQKSKNLSAELVLGAMIALEVIPGFGSYQGPGGGIGRIRVKGDKKAKKASLYTKPFPENFVENLQNVLEAQLNPTDFETRITRSKLAELMGCPGSETEAFISQAVRTGALPGFNSRQGIKGGIGRTLAVVRSESEEEDEVETESDEPYYSDKLEMRQVATTEETLSGDEMLSSAELDEADFISDFSDSTETTSTEIESTNDSPVEESTKKRNKKRKN